MKYKLAYVTTIAIAIQMVQGGIIVGKDAGFICPDWPLCYGQVMPPLTPLMILELVHRFSALLVSVLVIWTSIAVVKHYAKHRTLMWLVACSIVSLLLQVVVGGLIVDFKLPGVVTTVDVINSMLLLGIYVYMTVLLRDDFWRKRGAVSKHDDHLRRLAPVAWTSLASVLFAILVGALFRHTGASQALFGQDSYLLSHGQHTPPSYVASITMLMFHIFSGLVVLAAAICLLVSTYRENRLKKSTWLLMILIVVQMILGMISLDTQLKLLPVTLHWANAAGLMAVATFIAIRAYLHVEVPRVSNAASASMVPEPGALH